MAYYSYLLDHDYGLAPNPFGEYCTLAVCKPAIRKSGKLESGDWILGTGSKSMEKTTGQECVGKLIYAMKVDGKMGLNEYWHHPIFQYKKPITNGSLVSMFGDNFYHIDKGSEDWVQEDSAHSLEGEPNLEHLKTDVGGENVLIGKTFFYFGASAPKLPDNLLSICHTGVGMKKPDEEIGGVLIQWLYDNFEEGINGDPFNWRSMKNGQMRLF